MQRIIFGFILNKLINQNIIGYLLEGGEGKPRPTFVRNNDGTFYVNKIPEALLVFILFDFFLKTNQILLHSCFLWGPVLGVKGDFKKWIKYNPSRSTKFTL